MRSCCVTCGTFDAAGARLATASAPSTTPAHAGRFWQAIPRLGGIAISSRSSRRWSDCCVRERRGSHVRGERERHRLFGGGLAIALLGLSAIEGAPTTEEIAIQFSGRGTLYYLGFTIEQSPIRSELISLGWASAPVTVLWIVGVLNALT